MRLVKCLPPRKPKRVVIEWFPCKHIIVHERITDVQTILCRINHPFGRKRERLFKPCFSYTKKKHFLRFFRAVEFILNNMFTKDFPTVKTRIIYTSVKTIFRANLWIESFRERSYQPRCISLTRVSFHSRRVFWLQARVLMFAAQSC